MNYTSKLFSTLLSIFMLSACNSYKPPQHDNIAYLYVPDRFSIKVFIEEYPDTNKWKSLDSMKDELSFDSNPFYFKPIDATIHKSLKAYFTADYGLFLKICEPELGYWFKPKKGAIYMVRMKSNNSSCWIELQQVESTVAELKSMHEEGTTPVGKDVRATEDADIIVKYDLYPKT